MQRKPSLQKAQRKYSSIPVDTEMGQMDVGTREKSSEGCSTSKKKDGGGEGHKESIVLNLHNANQPKLHQTTDEGIMGGIKMNVNVDKSMRPVVSPNEEIIVDIFAPVNLRGLSLGADKSAGSSEVVKKYLVVFAAELLATSFLICIGCMSGVSGFYLDGLPIGQSAIGWGMVVACVVQIFGHISAAHLNPAVTVCFYILGDITLPMMFNYFLAELLGSIIGFGVLKALTPDTIYAKDPGMCCTVPHETVSDIQGFFVEFISTSFLILLVCACSDPRNSKKQDSTPLKFGVLVAAVSMIAGPYTGASINPTRSFAPAFWNQVWTSHWIYWVAPLLAGFVVPLIYQLLFRNEEPLRITRSLSRRIRGSKRT